ncbi:hypothetical protein HaLaN_07137 [Haematococcus lacustris]|uniref:Uncharacterized protein n=1 Tax=Haematococcus lacustris TaxID=44745 RepID=A0A699YMU2_HAELA|nr:hypothetical protein HaLaN_07137 [Haematococcus lacustris]
MGQFGSHRPPQDIAFAPARSIAQAVSVSLASSSAAMRRVSKSRDCPVERNRSRRCIYSPSLLSCLQDVSTRQPIG